MVTNKNDLRKLGDMECLALTIYGEARGEPIEGQIAIGCVIRNRVRLSGDSYVSTCLMPHQFSCWNDTDPNRVILWTLAGKILEGEMPVELMQQIWIARGIISMACRDNTIRAINYLERRLYNSDKRPKWADKLVNVKVIGNHVFGTSS